MLKDPLGAIRAMFSLLWRAASWCLLWWSGSVSPIQQARQPASQPANELGHDFLVFVALENSIVIHCFLYQICVSGCWDSRVTFQFHEITRGGWVRQPKSPLNSKVSVRKNSNQPDGRT